MAKQFLCKNCGYVGKKTSHTKGSIIIELFLWLCFLIPGLLYSLWRMTSTRQVCPICASENIIPVNSPLAQKIINQKAVI